MSDVCRAYFHDTKQRLRETHNLHVTVGTNMRMWKSLHLKAVERQGWSNVYPAFDPDVFDLNAGNSLWIGLRYGSRVVAWIAGRLIETDDFDKFLRSGNLWNPSGDTFPWWVAPDRPQKGGRFWHQGGLDVDPEYRGKRLGGDLARLVRAAGIIQFEANHGFGMEEAAMGATDVYRRLYGWHHKTKVFEEWNALGPSQDMYLTESSREETIEELGRG